MITLEQFYKGRDVQFACDLTLAIRQNAAETLRRANLLLDLFHLSNPSAASVRGCNSGWRPPAVNSCVANAAPKSKHMTGQAIDIEDDDGSLDAWLMTPKGQGAMANVGLWHEHPSATPRWAHVQTVPPASGKRTFMP